MQHQRTDGVSVNPNHLFSSKTISRLLSSMALILLLCIPLHAQSDRFKQLLEQGKAEFRAGEEMGKSGTGDIDSILMHYRTSVSLLERAVALESGSQEGHYFLAYAYDRLEAAISPGEKLPGMRLEQTRKISTQLEKVLEISPTYTGEIIILEPHSKLTSTWGSLAL
jgi:hypothetical protein